MADKKLNEVPVVSDIVTIFGKRSNGEIVQIDKSNLATLLGELLEVNETWFRNRGNIRGKINLDDFKDAGAYSLFNIEGNNVPTSWAQLLVFSSGYYITQIIVDASNRKLFIRRYDIENNLWKEWGNIIMT